jgi:hypothetical protein
MIKREYNCDGMCQFSKPSPVEIFNLKVINLQLQAQAYDGAYATPGERQQLNDAADASHNVAHWLAGRQAEMILREIGLIDNPYEYKYPTFDSDYQGGTA